MNDGRNSRAKARAESVAAIVAAARHLFVQVGYEAATMRRIAERSDMALGTLSYYVRDKRDLVYLIFNEDFDAATDAGIASCDSLQGFEAKVLALFEPFYRFFAREPELSRILLSEIQQQSPGFHLARNLKIRLRLIGFLEQLVSEAQQAGEIGMKQDGHAVAMNIFFCMSAAIRWWIATPNPKWKSGHKDFQRVLSISIHGVCVSSEPKWDRRSEADPLLKRTHVAP